MGVGKSVERVDAYEKVTGRARFTDDLTPPDALVAKIVRSAVANGLVTRFDLTEALKIPGVVKIVTCFDTPDCVYGTAGHPWSTDPAHQDVADRRLLNRRVRVYGDEIAAVIAEDEIAAARAAAAVLVEYDEYPPFVTPEQAMADGATLLHDGAPGNVLKHTHYAFAENGYKGDFDGAAEPDTMRVSGTYRTQAVQHCHIEPAVSFAYMEKGRIVVVSSTQIPTIVRRVVGQALGIPWGSVRVIKPYLGGGFGNKQEVLGEPLNAFLTAQVGGRPVKLELSREEVFACTRVRHAMDITLDTIVRPDGRIVARRFAGISNQGGYASHGHSIIANSASAFRHLYRQEKLVEGDARTVYTNITTGGAMRGYGIPQAIFALESHIDDVARAIGMDPLAFRRMNAMPEGYVDPANGLTCHTSGLLACLAKGAERIGWQAKRAAYANQTGAVRRGVGMAMFSYKTGVYPIGQEMACARLTLNEDGSVQLQTGATEIGQGADTVLTQIAAEALGIPEARIHLQSSQDTDITPFDSGAFASRQTYVSGMAVKQTALALKKKILDYASYLLKASTDGLDIARGGIVGRDGALLLPLDELATEAVYSLVNAVHLAAETTYHNKDNTFSFGCTFAEVEVDIPLGKVRVLDIVNVHDSGVLINPKLAEAQVHGGMSMGLGYGLSEQMLYDDKARPLNGNLLDYKLQTAMDTPDLGVDFVETADPTGPYGNKALGEPPTVPVAPALRNAVLNATGIAVHAIPLSPQRLVEAFTAAGLIPAANA